MKHLLLLSLAAVIGYLVWTFMDPGEAKQARSVITRHGLRLGAVIAVLLALLAAAYHFPSSQLF